MKALTTIALILLIVGGVDWLLVRLFRFDLVATIFGGQEAMIARIVYVIVGLCALYCQSLLPKIAVWHRRV
ncbi:hypothetical protein SGGMMB4_03345 [Sodalis glossinidius str. 'morsitans']|uniref:DUF378 domain-containing protein n=1 Tax=Sodalis glossinidius (strain morsitans) TaxID=343509 RepID=A0A193QKU4_SODGM|nr:DUF378 domain-containing protein [Sodalis glossinidius]CRL45545.1 hypothetical protein SGGMMB4_03345 [Sodalis glossinidius str. 'morsitans']